MQIEALRERGLDVFVAAWDDPSVDWKACDAAIIRSPWNYMEQPAEFLAWLRTTGDMTAVWNPPAVVHHNLHKGYLLELHDQGVPIVHTELVKRGHRVPSLEPGSWVVKPAVGGGSWKVKVLDSVGAEEYANALSPQEDILIQPYLSSVEQGGERALVWIDGEFTHKVTKSRRLDGEAEQVAVAGNLTDAELEVGRAAVATCPPGLLYARVDVMDDAEGQTVLSELELAEPSLFFAQNPSALHRFAAAIADRVSGTVGASTSLER